MTEIQPTTATTDPRPLDNVGTKHTWLTLIRRPAAFIGFVDLALIALFSVWAPNFFTVTNFSDMALDGSETVLLAVGTCMLLGAGELDISLGANVILSSLLGSKVIITLAGKPSGYISPTYPHLGFAIFVGVFATIATGIGIGLINGLLVTRLKINSFITTLATTGIATGIALVITGGVNVAGLPPQIQTGFGVRNIAHIPAPALVTAVAAVAIWFVLEKTRFGLRSLAVGSSREAAIRSGIRSRRIITALFCVGGAACGIAGVMDYSHFGTTDVGGHTTDALSAVAGVVIGGGAIFGGKVSVPGAVLGALLSVILNTGLVIAGMNPFYQLVAVGVVLIIAVYVRARSDQPVEQEER